VAVLRFADRPSDADVTGKPVGDLGIADTATASGLLAGDVGGTGANTSSTMDANVTVELKSVRVFEMPLGKELKDTLLADGNVASAAKRGLNPMVVFRSYEATPVFTVRQSASASAGLWERVKGRLLQAGATTAAEGTLRLVGTRPVVIAYETVSLNFITDHFAAGGATDVNFSPSAAEGLSITPLDAAAFALNIAKTHVNFITAGTSHYRSDKFGDLRSVEPSRELAATSLQLLGALPLRDVAALPTTQTSREAMDTYLDQIVKRLQAEKPTGFVFYYVGHTVARSGGQLYLVLSDYRGDLTKDLGDETTLGLPRAQLEAPNAPLVGSNIGDILNAVNAASGEFPDQTGGLYAVGEIHKRLEQAGVPFAVVVDGCFESTAMDQLRQELKLTKTGDYYGPAGGPTQELDQYAKALREFGVAPYLHDRNPVILSAKPGSIAMEVTHPAFDWGFAPKTGPLAAEMYRLAQASYVDGTSTSWGEYLRGLAAYDGTGEIEVTGSISWSDFSLFEGIRALEERK
jgi:hypothetical protein